MGEVIHIEMAAEDGSPVNCLAAPTDFSLSQNYPNPFNPTTTIEFSLPIATDYTLAIFNITGRKVVEFSGSADAGFHSIEWDANGCASGVYFYKLTAVDFTATRKLLLLR
jgi:hypothetical protein